MFTYDTIKETKEYIKFLFEQQIIPQFSALSEEINDRKVYICFQFDENDIKHIIQKVLGRAISIKPLDEKTSYIELDFYDELIHPKNAPPIYGGKMKNGNVTKTKCNDLIRLFREEYNIPFFYVSLNIAYGSAYFDFDQYNIGIGEDVSPGFFYRRDLDFAPRSSWEANLARVLNHKKIAFQYENEAISFERNDLGTKSKSIYIPDFFLDDGSVIEVKGFWDTYSREKCAYFSRTYPQRPYFILDSDFYVTLSAIYSDKIPEWEHNNSLACSIEHLQIVGTTYGKRKFVVQKLSVQQELIFERDTENKFDKNAILVKTLHGEEVGFLAADWACIYAPKIDLGMKFSLNVESIEAKKVCVVARRSNPEELILWDFLR